AVLAACAAFEPLSIAGLKAAVDGGGFYGGPPRRPMLPLTAAERRRVQEACEGLRRVCSAA
ncbi:MAG: hypothetical protein ACRD1L_12225, partial [Terriglobales bacterium]